MRLTSPVKISLPAISCASQQRSGAPPGGVRGAATCRQAYTTERALPKRGRCSDLAQRVDLLRCMILTAVGGEADLLRPRRTDAIDPMRTFSAHRRLRRVARPPLREVLHNLLGHEVDLLGVVG